MTVAELIEKLKGLPQDLPVVVRGIEPGDLHFSEVAEQLPCSWVIRNMDEPCELVSCVVVE